ncbi:MAG TPA: hypothetical protein VGH78_05845 [Solirubrobacteraceae bacterium]
MSLPFRLAGRALPILALLGVVLCGAAAPAASATLGLVVVPRPTSVPGLSYFKLHANPGSTARPGTIELRNPTKEPLAVLVSGVDGETLGTLGSTYAPPGSRAHRATLWLLPARRELVVAPRSSVAVPITVRVPSTAQPGDYLSGMSIEALGQRARRVARHGVSIASVSRYAIGVETSVPGARHPLIRFTGAAIQRQPAGLRFLLEARNPGNTILQGVYGFVRITQGSHLVLARPIDPGTFVTHTSIAYPVNAFRQTPSQGTRYRIVAALHYAGGVARLDTNVTFGHRDAAIAKRYASAPAPAAGGTAWWKIAGVVAALAYALLTTVLLLRRRERERETRDATQA